LIKTVKRKSIKGEETKKTKDRQEGQETRKHLPHRKAKFLKLIIPGTLRHPSRGTPGGPISGPTGIRRSKCSVMSNVKRQTINMKPSHLSSHLSQRNMKNYY
jgi:hypothetical protein